MAVCNGYCDLIIPSALNGILKDKGKHANNLVAHLLFT